MSGYDHHSNLGLQYLDDSDVEDTHGSGSGSNSASSAGQRPKGRKAPRRAQKSGSDSESARTGRSTANAAASTPHKAQHGAAVSLGAESSTAVAVSGAGGAAGSSKAATPGRYFSAPDWNIKCFNCNQRGHMASSCPNPPAPQPCYLCGDDSGSHAPNACPLRVCYNCGGVGHDSKTCRNKNMQERAASHGRRQSFGQHSQGYLGGAEKERSLLQDSGALGLVAPLPTQHGIIGGVSQELLWSTAFVLGRELQGTKPLRRMARASHGGAALQLANDLAHVTCVSCGKKGHAVCGTVGCKHKHGWGSTERPTLNLLQPATVGRSGCSNCGSGEHWEHACTMPRYSMSSRLFRDGTPVTCHVCGEEGHLIMHCPKRRARSAPRSARGGRGGGRGGGGFGRSVSRHHDRHSGGGHMDTPRGRGGGRRQSWEHGSEGGAGGADAPNLRVTMKNDAYWQHNEEVAARRADIQEVSDPRRRKKMLKKLRVQAKLSGAAAGASGSSSGLPDRPKDTSRGSKGRGKKRSRDSPEGGKRSKAARAESRSKGGAGRSSPGDGGKSKSSKKRSKRSSSR